VTRDQYARAFEDGGFRRTFSALKKVGAKSDQAEEIAQAAWARGWECLCQLKDEARITDWVIVIAINLFRSALRNGWRMSVFPSDHSEPEVARTRREVGIDLARALLASGRNQRAILQGFYMNGKTAHELAAELGISEQAVQQRLARGRATLRRALSAARNSRVIDSPVKPNQRRNERPV
jgi:RNA polymerase sigma factor (sigma-70 family)